MLLHFMRQVAHKRCWALRTRRSISLYTCGNAHASHIVIIDLTMLGRIPACTVLVCIPE